MWWPQARMRGPGMMSSAIAILSCASMSCAHDGADVAGEAALEQHAAGADADRHHHAGRQLLAGPLAAGDVELVEVGVQVAGDEPGHHASSRRRRSTSPGGVAGVRRRSTRSACRRGSRRGCPGSIARPSKTRAFVSSTTIAVLAYSAARPRWLRRHSGGKSLVVVADRVGQAARRASPGRARTSSGSGSHLAAHRLEHARR